MGFGGYFTNDGGTVTVAGLDPDTRFRASRSASARPATKNARCFNLRHSISRGLNRPGTKVYSLYLMRQRGL